MMRNLYHKCRLVHADLSEFNMLYYEGKVIVIDVSQAVEHDHPHALEFLRKDCNNVNGEFSPPILLDVASYLNEVSLI
jgi:RIO kinase 1